MWLKDVKARVLVLEEWSVALKVINNVIEEVNDVEDIYIS